MEDRKSALTSPVVPHGADAQPISGDASLVVPPRELRYRQLFESSPLPLWVYDLETLRFLDVNEVACAKYGYTRDEFLAMTILDIRPAEDAKAVADSVRETPASTFSSGIWRHRLKSGQMISVEITSHEMTFMGRATRFVCPIDVTLRLKAEASLRQREAGLRRAQSIARLAHVVSGADGRLEDRSENLARLAGVSLADLPATLDDWTQRFVHPDDRALLRQRVAEARASCERVDVEYRLVQPDGTFIHVAQVIEAVESGDAPQERRWFNTLQDVSEQKLEEERLVRQAAELEDRVQQRTAELRFSNDELLRATAAAQQASLAKSQFLSKISHELRTPLNAILGFGQLLQMTVRDGAGAQQQGAYGDNIVKAGNHLLSLINELLDLASIEAGRTSMAVEPLEMDAVLADCEAFMSPIAALRGIRIVLPRGDLPAVLADSNRLRQVLLNLVGNAVKYSPGGSTIDVRCRAEGAHATRISIVDQGAGMTATQVAALYEPFNRLGRDGGHTEGTGIGLVVTKSLVELMDGTIGVESTPGLGTTFWIDLPRPDGRQPGAAVIATSRMPAPGAPASPPWPVAASAGQSVLCIDDDPLSLQLIQDVLAHRPGLQVLTASNGRTGAELARLHLPDLIVIDNNMPEMTGSQARAILREDPLTARIPIIALSGSTLPDPVDAAQAGGYIRFIAKPFEVQPFLAAVEAALSATRPGDSG